MKLINIILMAMVILPSAFAMQAITGQIVRNESVVYYLENIGEVKDQYNSNIENVPGFVKKIFGDERVNAELELANGTTVEYYMITEKGVITSLEKGLLDDPTLNVKTKEEVITRILQSENQVQELQKAIDEKEISIEAVGVGMKLKMFFIKLAVKVGSWFT